MPSLGDLLRDLSPPLANVFDDIPVPGALAFALGLEPPGRSGSTAGVLEAPRGRVAMLAGPGVLRDHAVDGLRAFADAAHVGVANTWGAKGVFPWDSPHHLGTCGLQADDLELLGFAQLHVLWVTGLDELESPRERLALCPRIEVIDPRDLSAFSGHVGRSPHPITRPPLFDRLAAVAQPGYVDDRFPRHPARAVMDLKRALPPGALVTAEPGPAGLWVARTYPTDRPGTVVVPATARPGVGAAVGLAAATHGIPTTVVAVAPLEPVVTELHDLGASRGLPLTLEVWADDVDLSLTALLVEAAGAVVAWAP